MAGTGTGAQFLGRLLPVPPRSLAARIVEVTVTVTAICKDGTSFTSSYRLATALTDATLPDLLSPSAVGGGITSPPTSRCGTLADRPTCSALAASSRRCVGHAPALPGPCAWSWRMSLSPAGHCPGPLRLHHRPGSGRPGHRHHRTRHDRRHRLADPGPAPLTQAATRSHPHGQVTDLA